MGRSVLLAGAMTVLTGCAEETRFTTEVDTESVQRKVAVRTFASAASARPKLEVRGPAGPLRKAIEAELKARSVGRLGAVVIELTFTPANPPPAGKLTYTANYDAHYLHVPYLTHLEAKRGGTVDYALPSIEALAKRIVAQEDSWLEKTRPADPSPSPPAPGPFVSAVLVGPGGCGLQKNGKVRCWSQNLDGIYDVPGIENVTRIVAGRHRVCALSRAGTISCFDPPGVDLQHRFGTPCGLNDSVDLASVGEGLCAVGTDGRVRCRASVPDNAPATCDGDRAAWTVPGIEDAVEIAGSLNRAVVRTKAGEVKWFVPTKVEAARADEVKAAALVEAVPEAAPAKAVAAGMLELCALQAKGDIWCWKTGGKTKPSGDGAPAGATPAPAAQEPSSEGPIRRGAGTAVTVGFGHACSLQTDQTLRCWGYNVAGALGVDAPGWQGHAKPDNSHPPAHVVVAGTRRTCIIDQGGELWCWGGGLEGLASKKPEKIRMAF